MTVAISPSAGQQATMRRISWSPYGVGAGIGVLSWIAFGVAKDPLGVTTAYSRLASLFALPIIGADGVAANSYWKAMPLSLDYGVLFLIGLFFGSLASVLLAGNFRRVAAVQRVYDVDENTIGGVPDRCRPNDLGPRVL